MTIRDQMIGTWRLVEFRFTNADGTPGDPDAGPKQGRMEYTADGNMATATRQANGYYFSYFGAFEVKGEEVFHHIEIASDPKLDGTTTHRTVSFEGNRLVLTADPPVLGGPGTKASLIWEKVA